MPAVPHTIIITPMIFEAEILTEGSEAFLSGFGMLFLDFTYYGK